MQDQLSLVTEETPEPVMIVERPGVATSEECIEDFLKYWQNGYPIIIDGDRLAFAHYLDRIEKALLATIPDSSDRHGYRFDELEEAPEPHRDTTPGNGRLAIAIAYAALDEVLPMTLFGSDPFAQPLALL